MFRKASIAYIVVALAGVALLSVLANDPGPVPLGELEDHAGETVCVEGTVVAVDGERTVLWSDGATVEAYGRNPFEHGDRVRAKGYVSAARTVHLNVDSYSLIRATDTVALRNASSGSWVNCTGHLVVTGNSVYLNAGSFDVLLALHIDVDPVTGVELAMEGIFHEGAVHVYDRSCIRSDDVLSTPWISVGTVELQGMVALEPAGTSLSLATIDGTVRVICNTTGVHMHDVVSVNGTIDYDDAYCRFVVRGGCHLIASNGPVAPTAEDLFARPWRYEDATITVQGNVTEVEGRTVLVTGSGNIPVTGAPLSGMRQITGRLVLTGDLRYVIDVG